MRTSSLLACAGVALSLSTVCAAAEEMVSVPHFDSIELRGGGHVFLHHGPGERVALVAGSTHYTHFHVEDGRKLVIDACSEDCPSRYDLGIEITVPRLAAVAIDGGGKIEGAPGFPAQQTLAAAVDGGGDIDLGNVDVANATAAVEGGGHILVRADSVLTASVDGGGSIRYVGKAKVTTAINGGGSVEPE